MYTKWNINMPRIVNIKHHSSLLLILFAQELPHIVDSEPGHEASAHTLSTAACRISLTSVFLLSNVDRDILVFDHVCNLAPHCEDK